MLKPTDIASHERRTVMTVSISKTSIHFHGLRETSKSNLTADKSKLKSLLGLLQKTSDKEKILQQEFKKERFLLEEAIAKLGSFNYTSHGNFAFVHEEGFEKHAVTSVTFDYAEITTNKQRERERKTATTRRD